MRRFLAGRRVLLTGAAGGIGRNLAAQAAALDARLLLTGRDPEALEEVAAPLRARGADVVATAADLALQEDRQQVVDTAHECFGGLDVLINNAGVGSFGDFAGSSEAILREVMEV